MAAAWIVEDAAHYFKMPAMRARKSGSISPSNQGFLRAQPSVRQDGCGSGTYSGR